MNFAEPHANMPQAQRHGDLHTDAGSGWAKRLLLSLLLMFSGCVLLLDLWLAYITAQGESAVGTFVLSILFGVATLFVGIAWPFALRHAETAWSRPRLALLCSGWLVVTVLVFLMPATYWPMRFTFALQRPRLEQLAQRVARGDVPTQPVRLGFYTVTLAERNGDGVVCLWICPEGHRCIGFGRCTLAEVPRNFHNLNVQVALADNWQFVEED